MLLFHNMCKLYLESHEIQRQLFTKLNHSSTHHLPPYTTDEASRQVGRDEGSRMIGGIPHYGSQALSRNAARRGSTCTWCQPNDVIARSSRRGWQQIGWEAARRRCCRPVWSSTSSRSCPRPRRTLEGQQLDDGLAGGPDSSSGPPVKLLARGGQMVVGWGHCVRTVTQTQVLRAGVP